MCRIFTQQEALFLVTCGYLFSGTMHFSNCYMFYFEVPCGGGDPPEHGGAGPLHSRLLIEHQQGCWRHTPVRLQGQYSTLQLPLFYTRGLGTVVLHVLVPQAFGVSLLLFNIGMAI